jgi:hypothetical protein
MLGNILGAMFIVGSLYLATQLSPTVQTETITPWNHQLGITNSLKSNGNRDASMAIQSVRRNAIAAIHRSGYRPIRESKYTTGSTSGYLESYLLSSECPCPIVAIPCPDILDGQLSGNDICDIYDGNLQGPIYNAGNSETLVCNRCDAPEDTTFNGESATNEVCAVADGNMPDGAIYNAGTSETLVCNRCDAPEDTTFNGESATNEVCAVADGNMPDGAIYNAGTSQTLVCGN